MRKYIIMFIILSSFGISRGFGQVSDVSITDNDQERIMNNIRLTLDENNILRDKTAFRQIQSDAAQLDLLSRFVLKKELEKTMDKPYLLMNIVPGGLGSFIQGDKFGGIGGVVSDIVLALNSYLYLQNVGFQYGNLFLSLTCASIASSIYFKFMRPYHYMLKWNAALEEALLLDDLDYQSDLEAFEMGMNIPEAAPNLIDITLLQVRF